jgi:phage terminase large subunit-like protein
VNVWPRKNAKTTSLAALALYRQLTQGGNPEILLAASTEKQAGKLFDACAGFIRMNPWLQDRLRIIDHIGEILRHDGFGKIERMSTNWRAAHGGNPSTVVADELHTWTTPTLRELWAALLTGDAARSAPQAYSITTAGDVRDRDAPILGEMLNDLEESGEVEKRGALTILRDHESRTLAYVYEANLDEFAKERIRRRKPTAADIAAVKEANPASWVTEEYLLKKALDKGLQPGKFLQLHACVWAEVESQWISAESWRACRRKGLVATKGDEIVVGFDGSSYRDSTALVGYHVAERHLWLEAIWTRPDKIEEWKVPRREVKAAVAALAEKFELTHLVCDPAHWYEEIEQWGEELGLNSRREPVVIEFQTNRPALMAPATSRFESSVLERKITHDGSPLLAQHVANARVQPNGTIDKEFRSSKRLVDAAVAAILAHEYGSKLKPSKPGKVFASSPW